MKKLSLIFAFVLFATASVFAQIERPVTWSYAAKKINSKEAIIFLKASVDEGWHIYSLNVKPGGPIKTSVKLSPSKDYTALGAATEPKPIVKYEETFKMNVPYFEKQVIFQQKVKLNKGTTTVKGTVEFMACNDEKCLPPDQVSFSVPVK
ncbi:protein-disulfide reductase DsbD domain-containing protein [Pedobacter sp. SYP-B3415]|uniref:protein-disulfide reductase DsbD domain-containing protein n=1 Tax=Pedobacter sp. SYP-B3415 TaxID=2496641 RepID=UPI00101BD877|nr:protein-disulfide reductase DsbD domain-containing protein [Pedobacter sp. SYP-B3415]